MPSYIDMSSHCVDTSRHYLNMQTHLNMPRHINIVYRHQGCLDTLMIALENSIERKTIIYFI